MAGSLGLELLGAGWHLPLMNGVKIVEYTLFSPDWTARLERSGFGQHPNFAKTRKGRIALQDYGLEVAFRNIKIRPIDASR